MTDEVEAAWTVGVHAVLAALESGRPVELVWLQRDRRDHRLHRVLEAARARSVPTRLVARQRLDEVAGSVPHNGCAARTAPVALRPLEALVASPATGHLLLLEGVTDPRNTGAVIRTAAAFGVDGVVLAGPSAPPLGGALAKAAGGQLERVPLARSLVAADAMVELRRSGYWVFGADARGQDVQQVRPAERWVLCLGSEDRGLRAKTRHEVDEWVAVPMTTGVESLNVAVAAGILLYALCRER